VSLSNQCAKYISACLARDIDRLDLLGLFSEQFQGEITGLDTRDFDLSLEELKKIYDAFGEMVFVLSHPKINEYREEMKDHVLGCLPPNTETTADGRGR
jgi:hypothetical protein